MASIVLVAALIRVSGMTLLGNAVRLRPTLSPVRGSYTVVRPWKFPARTCAVGTLKNAVPRSAVVVPSQEAKKNSLSFLIGPPMVPPYWLSIRWGVPEPAGVLGLKNRGFAAHL